MMMWFKKSIAIFSNKLWVLSIELKTNVKSDWMRDWKSVRVRNSESESERVCEWLLSIDMKTKVVQHVESEWMREWNSESVIMRHWESVRVREWLLSRDMKTKVIQYDESEWMTELETVREWSGSQLLSDVQTFFSWESPLWKVAGSTSKPLWSLCSGDQDKVCTNVHSRIMAIQVCAKGPQWFLALWLCSMHASTNHRAGSQLNIVIDYTRCPKNFLLWLPAR